MLNKESTQERVIRERKEKRLEAIAAQKKQNIHDRAVRKRERGATTAAGAIVREALTAKGKRKQQVQKQEREEKRSARKQLPKIERAMAKGTLARNPDTYKKLKVSKNKGYFPAPKKAKPTDYNSPDGITVTRKAKPTDYNSPDGITVARKPNTSRAVPKANPPVSTRSTANAGPKAKPPVPNRNMIGGTPPGGGTLSKKDVDEYSEAFASPDADKMYKLSEKNRRTDMNMLERAFDSIKVAGDRATADRKKRGLSNYDMNEDVFGSRLGGGIKNTMNNKQPSTRKRAAQRGFGVETRGN